MPLSNTLVVTLHRVHEVLKGGDDGLATSLLMTYFSQRSVYCLYIHYTRYNNSLKLYNYSAFFSQNHIVSLWSVTNVQGLGTSGVGHIEQNVASSIYRLFNHSQGSLTVLKYNNKVVIGNVHLKHTVARLLWFLLLYELLGKKDIVHKQHNNANKSSKVFT